MFERFTDRVRRVLVLAQEESRLLGHSFIGSEHLFLGLVAEEGGVAARTLASVGVELEPARWALSELVGRQPNSGAQSPPFTPRAKKVLELALRAAIALGSRTIDTGHLLAAVLEAEHQTEGIVTELLAELGADPVVIRRRLEDALGGWERDDPAEPGFLSRPIERFFEHLSARDWDALREVLAPDVERIGPFGDRVAGCERYLDLLAGVVPKDYGNDVRRVTYARDRRSGFARVTEHLGYPGLELHLEEAYAFELDAGRRIARVEIFTQSPDDPGGFGSATSDESFGSRRPVSDDDDEGET